MKISIFGLGYVGTVLSACFANAGHRVIGVDPDEKKVDLVNGGQSPVIETGLDRLVARAAREGWLRATGDSESAVLETEISMVCVGTPSTMSGDADLSDVRHACQGIGRALRKKQPYHLVVIRSTLLPGTTRNVVIPALQQTSGRIAGRDFGVAVNPEFMRESSAIHDFYNPSKTVIGSSSPGDGKTLADLYNHLPGPMIQTSIDVAEMLKYADNAFHALKITFANEIGRICKRLDIDSSGVMEIICQDKKLALSPAYLKPGFAYGGSCLPKDLRALTRLARIKNVPVPILDAISASNTRQIQNAAEWIKTKCRHRIGMLGIAFKTGTDDLRESPLVLLAKSLLREGYDLKIYDAFVSPSRLIGSNLKYIQEQIPHFSELLAGSISEVLEHSEAIVVGHENPEYFAAVSALTPARPIIDLTATSTQFMPAPIERTSAA